MDFTYEVSRSLAACEGALLIVDATEGVEAQTVSNVLLAMEHDLAIIPIINKIDMPSEQSNLRAKANFNPYLGDNTRRHFAGAVLRKAAGLRCSSQGLSPRIYRRTPVSRWRPYLRFPLRFVPGGCLLCARRRWHAPSGHAHPFLCHGPGVRSRRNRRAAFATADHGEPGGWRSRLSHRWCAQYWRCAGGRYRDDGRATTGGAVARLPGAQTHGLQRPYPSINPDAYDDLRNALARLRLNDAAFSYEPETSAALGFGFRCGFLGLLHMEIVQERLEREYDMEIITTVPNVRYEVLKHDGTLVEVENPSALPPANAIAEISEPILSAQILVPSEYIGNIMKLVTDRRGVYLNTRHFNGDTCSPAL